MAIYIIGNPSQPPATGVVYPTATHYAHPQAGGGGVGTISNPFTMAQAMALAQPGWRVQLDEGDFIGTANIGRASPVWAPANNGTESNPIIFFAKNPAALNTTGRTVLRHTGTTQGQGCPVIGLRTGHQLWGVYINEEQAYTYPDTGPMIVTGSYNAVRYCRFLGATTPWPIQENNHAAIRVEAFQDNIPAQHNYIADNVIERFTPVGWNGSNGGIHAMSAGASSWQILWDLVVEHNYFDNNGGCLTIKGAGPQRPVHGLITCRKNISRPASGDDIGHYFLMDMGSVQGRNRVVQNVMFGGTYGVMTYNQADYPVTGFDYINNTLINIRRPSPGDRFGVHADWRGGNLSQQTWRIHNNVAITQGAPLSLFAYTNQDAMLSRSHNTVNGGDFWVYAEGPYPGEQLANWQSIGWDAQSFTRNPLFASTTWGSPDLGKLAANSLERGSGIDILNLLGNGTSAPINRGAYITADMSDLPPGPRALAA